MLTLLLHFPHFGGPAALILVASKSPQAVIYIENPEFWLYAHHKGVDG